MNHTNLHSESLLKLTLWALAIYFLLIALAHITNTKLPLLFVYYNVPSEAYQDNIISFLSFGWAVFFATVARDPVQQLKFVRAILIAASGAIFGLSYNNITTDFTNFSSEIAIWPFWVQTGMLAGITCWILLLYLAVKKVTGERRPKR